MVDATVTPANVVKGSDAGLRKVTYGATIAQGKTVYKDNTDGEWKLADADASAATAGAAGIGYALTSGADGQDGVILGEGASSPFDPGFTATEGVVYCVSATAGGIAPFGDLVTGDYVTIIGVGDSNGDLVPIFKVTGAQVQ